MSEQKIDGLIGFAIRARRIAFGETILSQARTGKYFFTIIANDVSENTKKKLLSKLDYYRLPFVLYGSKEKLGSLLAKEAVSAIAILDLNIAKQIQKLIKEGD